METPPAPTPSLLRRRLPLLLTSIACALAHASPSFAGNVFFDGNGSSSNVLSTPANWSTNVLPSGTDQAIFTDAAFGGPLFSTGTNSTAQTWGSLTWNSATAFSSTLVGSAITLTGSGGTPDIITLGSLMTTGSLSYGVTSVITATNANINVVNGGATLKYTSQFEFNNTIANQVITKTGAGTLSFTNGNNGNNGNGANAKFILDGGTLNFSTNTGFGSFGASGVVLEIRNGTFLDTAGAGFDTILSKNNAEIWAGDFTFKGTTKNLNLGTGAVTMTGSRQVTVNALTLTVAGVIGDGGSGYGLTKAGAGVLSLTGSNTYTGATVANSGTLSLNFTAAAAPTDNIVSTSSGLRLEGGTLLLNGKASTTNSQTFNGVTLKAGASVFTGSSGATGGVMNATLGTVTRNEGSTVRFNLPAAGAIAVSNSNDANGLFGPGILVGSSDWATISAGNVVAFTGYTSANTVGTWAANQNITTTAATSGSLTANLALNSLRLSAGNNAATVNLGGKTLTIADGILVAAATTQGQTISNGTLQGANGELVLINNNGSGSAGATQLLTISANIVNNAIPTALTVSGFAGNRPIVLSGSNSYTGATYVNASTLRAGSANPAFGINSAIVISTGATLDLNNFSQSVGSLASNTSTSTGLVTLGTGTLTTGGDNTSTTFGGTISGAGGLVKVGTGTQTLTGANTYTGLTRVNLGTLLVNGSLAAGGSVVVDAGTLGGSGAVNSLVSTVGVTSVISPGNSPGTLTLAGGLDASAGATFVFELGTNSDLLNLGSGVLTGSTSPESLVFNFINSGGLTTGTAYTLMMFGSSTGLDYSDLLANTLPSGFVLDSSFGTGGFQINGSSLEVQFAAVPEPSTVALAGLGLAGLLALRRKRA